MQMTVLGKRRDTRLTVARASTLFLLMALFSACAATQVGTEAPTPRWSDNMVDAIPADASAAMMVRMHDEHDSATAKALLGAGLAALRSSSSFEDLGIALDNGVAAYMEGISAVFLAPLADSEKFAEFLEELHDSTGWEWSRRTLDQALVMSSHPPGGGRIDAGLQGNMGFIRVSLDKLEQSDADETLRSLLRGHPNRGTLSANDVGHTLLSDAEHTPIRNLAWMSTSLVDNAARFFLGGGSEEREFCVAAADEIMAAVPWLGVATFQGPSDSQASFKAIVRSSGSQERLNSLFPPAVPGILEAMPDTPLVISGRTALFALVELFPPDAELASCNNIAGVVSRVGVARRSARSGVTRDLREYSGVGAFALQNFEMAGFIPLADLALMAGHSNPPTVLNRVQRMLRGAGSTGRVIEDAAITTIEHQVLAYSLKLMQTEQRVVMGTSDMPHAGLTQMATSELPSQGPFLLLRWDGATTRPMIEAAIGLYATMEGWDEARIESVLNVITPLLAFDELSLQGNVQPAGLVVEGTLR